jgi:hypothetical protein
MKCHGLACWLVVGYPIAQVQAWKQSASLRAHFSFHRQTSSKGCHDETPARDDAIKKKGRNCRQFVKESVWAAASLTSVPCAVATDTQMKQLRLVTDPSTYSALVYVPAERINPGPPPLLIILHGAGKNEETAWSLADPMGEHAGLLPSLLRTGQAPVELVENFAVVAPYAAGRLSFYEDPRSKVLQFVDWVCSEAGRQAGCPEVEPDRVFLFGFSD